MEKMEKMEKMQKPKNLKAIDCKIILVGDSGVGKTCIIERYLKKYNPNVTCTINTSFYSKMEIIDSYQINFLVWDTVGQERYRSLNSLFFKDAHICIFVYDITNEDSFNNIKDYCYESVITNGAEGIICGVAGNKSDLYIEEKVDKKEVEEFCKEINATIKFVSAKADYGINELFEELGNIFVNSDFMKEIRESNYNKNEIEEKLNFGKTNKQLGKKGCC